MSWSNFITDEQLIHAPRLREEDIDITTGCAAVHPMQRGGQHVAMECGGMLMTHRPTGIAVLVTEERSQHKNRIVAYGRLCRLVGVAREHLGEYIEDKPVRGTRQGEVV